MKKITRIFLKSGYNDAAEPNSPLAVARFGADALGQQEDMWLRYAPLKFAIANFTYPRNVIRHCQNKCSEVK